MNTRRLNIVADENIPYVKEAFETIGRVKLVPGRSIRPVTLRDAKFLLVRSVTKVNQKLLELSPIQFVGTATAGLDHIDAEYLQSHRIAFASAQGGNSNSVAEYVITALLAIARREGITLSGRSIGIVGVGNIGRRVKSKAESLGMTVVLNDPPLAQETDDKNYRSLEEALDCDVVTLHVPLNFEGPFKTFHLFNEGKFQKLNPTAIFINTSRGEVIDSSALLKRLQNKKQRATVLDVWESEPAINWELFKWVCLGTSHIAGYSLDGKAQGTFLIYQALCQHLNITPSWRPSDSLPAPDLPYRNIEPSDKPFERILGDLATDIYDIKADHSRMAALLNIPPEARPLAFDRLRKNYPIRREFQNTTVKLLNGEKELKRRVAGVGFKIER